MIKVPNKLTLGGEMTRVSLTFIYLFIFGCVGSSVRARAFSSCGKWGATLHRGAGTALHRGARAFHDRGPSRCGAQAPDAQAQ